MAGPLRPEVPAVPEELAKAALSRLEAEEVGGREEATFWRRDCWDWRRCISAMARRPAEPWEVEEARAGFWVRAVEVVELPPDPCNNALPAAAARLLVLAAATVDPSLLALDLRPLGARSQGGLGGLSSSNSSSSTGSTFTLLAAAVDEDEPLALLPPTPLLDLTRFVCATRSKNRRSNLHTHAMEERDEVM
jgi:hypothetical protein